MRERGSRDFGIARLTTALALLLTAAAIGPAPATAASPPPCPPGTSLELDTRDLNESTPVATHPVELSPQFSSTDVLEATVQVRAPAGVRVSGRSGSQKPLTILSAKPGALPLAFTWVEEHEDRDRTTRCAGSATTTLRLAAPTRPRIAVPENWRQLAEYPISVSTDGTADLSPVTVRFRARRGPKSYPSGRFSVATWDLLSGRGGVTGARLSASGGLHTTIGRFVQGAAGIRVGTMTRYGVNTRQGVFPKGGFEIELRQSGRRLVRVRAKLDACVIRSGCRVNAKVERGR